MIKQTSIEQAVEAGALALRKAKKWHDWPHCLRQSRRVIDAAIASGHLVPRDQLQQVETGSAPTEASEKR